MELQIVVREVDEPCSYEQTFLAEEDLLGRLAVTVQILLQELKVDFEDIAATVQNCDHGSDIFVNFLQLFLERLFEDKGVQLQDPPAELRHLAIGRFLV